MREQLDAFLVQVPDLVSKTPAGLIEVFVYFLTVIKGQGVCTPSEVEKCFEESQSQPYSNVPAYLSTNSVVKKGKKPIFVHSAKGYQRSEEHTSELQSRLH